MNEINNKKNKDNYIYIINYLLHDLIFHLLNQIYSFILKLYHETSAVDHIMDSIYQSKIVMKNISHMYAILLSIVKYSLKSLI